jgi:hypothetical protein
MSNSSQTIAAIFQQSLLARVAYAKKRRRILLLGRQRAARLLPLLGSSRRKRTSSGSEARRRALAQAEDFEKRIAVLRREQIKAEQLSTNSFLPHPLRVRFSNWPYIQSAG